MTKEKLGVQPDGYPPVVVLPIEDGQAVALVSEAHENLRHQIHYGGPNDPKPSDVDLMTEIILEKVLTCGSVDSQELISQFSSHDDRVDRGCIIQALLTVDTICENAKKLKSAFD